MDSEGNLTAILLEFERKTDKAVKQQIVAALGRGS